MMSAVRTMAMVFLVLAAGCAGTGEAPPVALDPEARLLGTPIIGVFTRLTLRNQADDLLQQLRAHHRGGQETSLSALRQTYNMLVLKVLALVQDGDPSLARVISGSREAIWEGLADPEKTRFGDLTRGDAL